MCLRSLNASCCIYICICICITILKQEDYRPMRSNSSPFHPLLELFPLTISLFKLIISCLRFNRKSYHCKFFLQYQDVVVFQLSTKFELDRSTSNGDLLSESNHWKRTQMHKLTESDTIGYRVDTSRLNLTGKAEAKQILIKIHRVEYSTGEK